MKNKSIRRILLSVTFAAGAVFLFPGAAHAADDCQAACNLYTECVEFMNGRTATADEKKTLTGGCMKTCNLNKHKAGIMMCYKESKGKEKANACKTYAQCILKNSKK